VFILSEYSFSDKENREPDKNEEIFTINATNPYEAITS